MEALEPGQAAVVPRPPHPVRQQPARRDPGAAAGASPTRRSSRSRATTRPPAATSASGTATSAGARATMFDRVRARPCASVGNLAPALAEARRDRRRHDRGRPRQGAALRRAGPSSGYQSSRLWADAWCAAFVIRKAKADDLQPRITITEKTFRAIERNPHVAPSTGGRDPHAGRAVPVPPLAPGVPRRVPAARRDRRRRHPRLARRVRCSARQSAVGADQAPGAGVLRRAGPESPTRRTRPRAQRMIEQLARRRPVALPAFLDDAARAEGESHFVRDCGRYPLCGRGDVNTYALFAELNRQLIRRPGGSAASSAGIATDDTTKFFFRDLVERELSSASTLRERGVPLPGRPSLDEVLPPHADGLGSPAAPSRFRLLRPPDGAPRRARAAFHLTAEDIAC